MSNFTVFNVADMDTSLNKELLREMFLLWENKNKIDDTKKQEIITALKQFNNG
jgi:hypothetical protein